ncbi:hypothetical protein G9A89_002556 [Geosiphon pyriformis]|nr:hypothetical protein G9A89_002556 [Geosiphon pyriformis]
MSINLASAMTSHFVNGVSEFFDTDHKSVPILIDLGGLLDTHLISIYKQTNRDWWKFKLKDTDDVQWLKFKDCSSAKLLARSDMFKETKSNVLPKIPDLWTCQYMPLNYVDDDAFSGTMNEIGMKKLSLVVDNLPNNKTAGLSGISNKLWKCCSGKVLACLLKLLNLCLSIDTVPDLWKEAWVSMILKPYE